jgi:hypothetical protein
MKKCLLFGVMLSLCAGYVHLGAMQKNPDFLTKQLGTALDEVKMLKNKPKNRHRI